MNFDDLTVKAVAAIDSLSQQRKERRPIAAAALPDVNGIVVVCTDGTAWFFMPSEKVPAWRELPSIPGTVSGDREVLEFEIDRAHRRMDYLHKAISVLADGGMGIIPTPCVSNARLYLTAADARRPTLKEGAEPR